MPLSYNQRVYYIQRSEGMQEVVAWHLKVLIGTPDIPKGLQHVVDSRISKVTLVKLLGSIWGFGLGKKYLKSSIEPKIIDMFWQ